MNPINPVPLDALRLVVSQALKGSKTAIRQGRDLFVSPAMYDLIAAAKDDPAELFKILAAIRVLDLPAALNPFAALNIPMTTMGGFSCPDQ